VWEGKDLVEFWVEVRFEEAGIDKEHPPNIARNDNTTYISIQE
jgi:hypothetical protein